jgi:hypothetical protein
MKPLFAIFSLLLSISAIAGTWTPQTEAEVHKMYEEFDAGDYKAFKQYKKKGLNPNFNVNGGRAIFIQGIAGNPSLKYTKNHYKILDLLLELGVDLNAKQPLGTPSTVIAGTLNLDFLKWAVNNGGKLDLVHNWGGFWGDFTAIGATCDVLGWNEEANQLIYKKLQFVKDEFGYDLNENGLCSCAKFIPFEPEHIEAELLEKFPELEDSKCN